MHRRHQSECTLGRDDTAAGSLDSARRQPDVPRVLRESCISHQRGRGRACASPRGADQGPTNLIVTLVKASSMVELIGTSKVRSPPSGRVQRRVSSPAFDRLSPREEQSCAHQRVLARSKSPAQNHTCQVQRRVSAPTRKDICNCLGTGLRTDGCCGNGARRWSTVSVSTCSSGLEGDVPPAEPFDTNGSICSEHTLSSDSTTCSEHTLSSISDVDSELPSKGSCAVVTHLGFAIAAKKRCGRSAASEFRALQLQETRLKKLVILEQKKAKRKIERQF